MAYGIWRIGNAIHPIHPLKHALSSIQVCKHVSETVEISGTSPCCMLIVINSITFNVVDDCEHVIIPSKVLDQMPARARVERHMSNRVRKQGASSWTPDEQGLLVPRLGARPPPCARGARWGLPYPTFLRHAPQAWHHRQHNGDAQERRFPTGAIPIAADETLDDLQLPI